MNKIKLLLVDDDEIIYLTIQRMLDPQTYDIEWLSDTDIAIDIISKESHDLYIFDYHIDQHDGIELFNLVKENITVSPFKITKPVILLTGSEEQQVAIDAMHAGISDLLPKDNLSKGSIARTIKNANDKYELHCVIEKHRKDLEEANATLQQKNFEIQSFYQTVSHELKTPLTSIREFISIVIDGITGELNTKQTECLEIAKNNCDQMKLFINDLLDISKLDTGKFIIKQDSYPLDAIIEKSVFSMQPTAKENDIELSYSLPGKDLNSHVDQQRIMQVLTNLLANAIKFTPAGGKISVDLNEKYADDFMCISVQDTGCGIEPAHVDKIFNRLYQIKNDSNMHHRGLGLGLNICQELIALHNGSIWVESEMGEGSRFSFTVPINNKAFINQEYTNEKDLSR